MYWFTGMLGLALLLAPFAFNFTGNPGALWTSLLIGAGVIVVSIYEGMDKGKVSWEYWLAVIGGGIAIFAPFIFNFGSTSAAWTTLGLGVVLVVVAGYKLFYGLK